MDCDKERTLLQPGSRRLLLDAVRPPEGYSLDRAIGTSYSLDLVALLTVPLAFTFHAWEDRDGRPSSDPIALLEAVRRNADRIHLFCQAGGVKVPKPGQPLLTYLEPCVVEVLPPNERGVFHPKVWALRYVAPDGPIRYRLICATRNLTFDRSWDTALVLEGALVDRKVGYGRNRPLTKFVAALPQLASREVPAPAAESVSLIADEIARVDFELPEGFDDLVFHPLGLGKRASAWPFPDTRRPALVVSPFVSPAFLADFAERRKRAVLVSRAEELSKLEPEELSFFEEVLVLDSAADLDAQEADDAAEADSETASETLTGLHAKLFVIDDGWNASVWTGSANATDAAFERNVEFLVELWGKKSAVGVDTILGADDDSRKDAGLRDLLTPFRPPEEGRVAEDLIAAELERLLAEGRSAIVRSNVEAHVRDGAEAETHDVALAAADDRLELPKHVSARAWPVALPGDASVPLTADGSPSIAVFRGLSFAAVTAFFAFEVEARLQGRTDTVRFVLNVPLIGAPEDRRQRLLHTLLRDREQVMRLLWILLAQEELSVEDIATRMSQLGRGAGRGDAGLPGIPLLEPLLESLSRDRTRLDEVARLLEELRATPKGQELLPPDFSAIWEPIWRAKSEIEL